MSLILDGTNGLSDVDGSAATPAIRGTDANTGIFFPAADTIAFAEGGSEAMRIDSSGNLGIGTSAPSAKLQVSDSQNGTTVDIVCANTYYGASSTDEYATFQGEFYQNDVSANRAAGYMRFGKSGDFASSANASAHITFATRNAGSLTEKMRLESSGNLLVGTTNNTNGTRATIKAGNGTQLTLDNDGSQFTEVYWANNGTNKSYMWWDNTNTRFQIQSGGSGGVYLASTGTSWTSASDERVKDIIEPIENATQKLSGWRAVVGKYKADEEGTRRSFLIAQDVLSTFPEAVDTTNADEYGVRYQDTIPVLVAAIKEQQVIIEQLKARLDAANL